jgi:hypothetical protein
MRTAAMPAVALLLSAVLLVCGVCNAQMQGEGKVQQMKEVRCV